VDDGRAEEGLALLGRVPETDAVRKVAAKARLAASPDQGVADDYDEKLAGLLDQVKTDETARQEFVDILELMGPDDPRTAGYRRELTKRLF
jgi:putative thioredoxin